MIFIFKGLPPSDNSLYMTRGKFRVLSPEARQYKKDIEESTLLQIASQDSAIHRSCPSIPDTDAYTTQILNLKDKLLIVNVLLTGSWYTKTDSIRKRDCQNYTKAVIDSLFNAMKTIEPTLDDSQIWFIQVAKIQGEKEQTEIALRLISDKEEKEDK